jgi:EmrB/QacA subfamily drug resistance transporter
MTTTTDKADRARWFAFAILCLGDLMIVLDSTIVNVALPSISQSLRFSEAGLVWVVNSYLLTFGGCLLLGGRLADLYGQRRLFLAGLTVFTVASLVCGLAWSQTALVVARAVQGIGGAVVSAVALSLIMGLFPDEKERVRAMGYFGFIAAGGGSVGVLLGGLIVNVLDWRWIFFVNIPIGAAVMALSFRILPGGGGEGGDRKLDLPGAVTVTAALMLAVYAIVSAEAVGWTSFQTLGLGAVAIVLLGLFLVIEAVTPAPLMPLDLFKSRNVSTANIAAVLWAAAMFAWFFLSALYMQRVLHYTPMQVGLAFLPSNLIMGAFSYSLSAKIVNRFGIRAPLVGGLALAGLGLALFAIAPVDGQFVLHVLPPMLLLGIGAGIAFNPMMLAAMNDVEPDRTGLASGVVNTAFMMGGALGLAVLASLAAVQTNRSLAAGAGEAAALTAGYNLAFLVGALCAIAAAVISGLFLRPKPLAEDASLVH